jgi:NADPH2:quinone reductase
MKAIVSTVQGARLVDVPVPQPQPNEILVRVKAASLNRADSPDSQPGTAR